MLSDEEFKTKFFAESNDLGKIQLCIREGRFNVAKRTDKPNLPDAVLLPILSLPSNHLVRKSERKSQKAGSNWILELHYSCVVMGIALKIYAKCFYAHSGNYLDLCLEVQSLRDNEIR